MADELMTQITKAINEQLPAQIGDALKNRLILADLCRQLFVDRFGNLCHQFVGHRSFLG